MLTPPDNDACWPSGDYVDAAQLNLSDAEVEMLTGQKLNEGMEEGLGLWLAVAGTLESGSVIELIKYIESPGPESYVLRLDKWLDSREALQAVLSELAIEQNLVLWNRYE